MKLYVTHDQKEIYVFQNIIPKDICNKWIEDIEKSDIILNNNQSLSLEVYNTLKDLLGGTFPVKESGCRSEVNLAKRGVPIRPHFDDVFGGEKWKVLCYLNNVEGGGTDFKDGENWISIEPGEGHLIIFDIGIFHRGSLQQECKKKYTIGIRLLE